MNNLTVSILRDEGKPTKSRVAAAILGEMGKDPNRIFPTAWLVKAAHRALRRPASIGPMLNHLVSKGVIQRPWSGAYHLTKRAMPSR